MKWIPALILSLAMLGAAQAAGPDDQYLEIYNLIQQADGLNQAADARNAAAKYVQAQSGLKKLQEIYPNWNPDIVKFRLDYVSGKLADVVKIIPQTNAPAANAAPKTASLAELQQQISDLAEQVRGLAAEKTDLEKKLKESLSVKPAAADPELTKAQEEVVALKKERDLLNASLELEKADARAKVKPADDANATRVAKQREELQAQLELTVQTADHYKSQLAAANTEIASLKAAREQLKEAENAKAALEKECADLKKKLAVKEAKSGVKTDDSAPQIAQLRARLAVLEASPVPYTVEELALLKTVAQPKAATVHVETPAVPVKKAVRSAKDLPPGAGAMMADAQRSFVAGDFATAEKKYSEVLRQDDKNVYVLSHLANAQMAQNHFEDAEVNIQKALKSDPDDAASLFLLGNLRLHQDKLDDALDALSRSASINSTNAVTQNSLGSVLSRKGQIKAAEAALRKALQLDPKFPEAHHNLAIVYATQKPPSMELARWHYKKALDYGQPKNPELEKILDGAAPSAAAAAAPAPATNAPAAAAAPDSTPK